MRLEANEVEVGSERALVGDVPRLRPETGFKDPDWLNREDELSPN